MGPRVVPLVLAVVLALAPTTVFAAEVEDPEPGVGVQRLVASIASFFKVSDGEVQALRERGLGLGAIVHAFRLSQLANVSVNDIVEKHLTEGKGWGEIARELGVRFGVGPRRAAASATPDAGMVPPGQVFRGEGPAGASTKGPRWSRGGE